ncbi:MAG: hypothetical protein R3C58_08125 [Parvularculaceae bacterium]
MIGRMACAVAAAALMAGCMATSKKESPLAAEPVSQELAGLGPIGDAALPEKSCGMILWTLEGSTPTPVFRYVSGEKAEVNVNGAIVTLVRADYSGASGYGVSERQHFESAGGLRMDVSARFGLGFNGGAYLEQGLIKLENDAGWSLITPAAGIAGCRN